MAKTRLNNADRAHIAKAIIDYKYEPQFAVNRALECALAKRVYERLYTPDLRKKMAALPDGAFPETCDLMMAVNGQRFVLKVSEDGYDELGNNPAIKDRGARPTVRTLYKHRHVNTYNREPALSVLDDDDLGAAVVEWRRERDRLKEEPANMRRKVDATLSQFVYFDDLVAQFPEAQSFIMKRWRERPEGGSPGVPAIVIKDLAKALDLPPELAEAA